MNLDHNKRGRRKTKGKGLPDHFDWWDSEAQWVLRYRKGGVQKKRSVGNRIGPERIFKKEAVARALEWIKSEFPSAQRKAAAKIPHDDINNLRVLDMGADEAQINSLRILHVYGEKTAWIATQQLGAKQVKQVESAYRYLAKIIGAREYSIRFLGLFCLFDKLAESLTDASTKMAEGIVALKERYESLEDEDGVEVQNRNLLNLRKLLRNRGVFEDFFPVFRSYMSVLNKDFRRDWNIGSLFFGEVEGKQNKLRRDDFIEKLFSKKMFKDTLWNAARIGLLKSKDSKKIFKIRLRDVSRLERLETVGVTAGNLLLANAYLRCKNGSPPLFLNTESNDILVNDLSIWEEKASKARRAYARSHPSGPRPIANSQPVKLRWGRAAANQRKRGIN
jgi:hypothetical protein